MLGGPAASQTSTMWPIILVYPAGSDDTVGFEAAINV